MAKEDILLGVEMGKLVIEPTKIHIKPLDDNPFKSPTQVKKNISKTHKLCACSQKSSKCVAISKKKKNRILKEPVLKILKTSGSNNTCINKNCLLTTSKDILQCSLSHSRNPDYLNLFALVDNCNQLRISAYNEGNLDTGSVNNKQLKSELLCSRQCRESAPPVSVNRAGSCSQQALNPPCDVTIDELASYFETLVHIPKKMSSMAEMMYI